MTVITKTNHRHELGQISDALTTVETDTSTNTTDIAALDTRLTTAETNISSNDTDIATNLTNIATNTTNIATNTTNIATNTTNIAGKVSTGGVCSVSDLVIPDQGELTISSGVVTATGSKHRIDTESNAASDDLDTINGGTDGMILIIRAEDASRSVVCKDGTGNLALNGQFTLNTVQDTLMLYYVDSASTWVELSRSSNA